MKYVKLPQVYLILQFMKYVKLPKYKQKRYVQSGDVWHIWTWSDLDVYIKRKSYSLPNFNGESKNRGYAKTKSDALMRLYRNTSFSVIVSHCTIMTS